MNHLMWLNSNIITCIDWPVCFRQVFHLCHSSGLTASFVCPAGTLFNQPLLTCDHSRAVDCHLSELHYHVNSKLYQVQWHAARPCMSTASSTRYSDMLHDHACRQQALPGTVTCSTTMHVNSKLCQEQWHAARPCMSTASSTRHCHMLHDHACQQQALPGTVTCCTTMSTASSLLTR